MIPNKPIALSQAFPVPAANYAGGEFFPSDNGMTYRQWLVGTIAAGIAANSGLVGMGTDLIAITAIDLADQICNRLDGTQCSNG